MNRLLRMANIYLKAPIENKRNIQKLDFLRLKNSCSGQIFWSSNSSRRLQLINVLFQLKNQRSGSKIMFDLSIIFILKGIVTL